MKIPSYVCLGKCIFAGQNWTYTCNSIILTPGTLVCLVGALYLLIFAISDAIFCALFEISFEHPNQEQLVAVNRRLALVIAPVQ